MSQQATQLSQIVEAVRAFEKQWKPQGNRSTFFGSMDIWYYLAINDNDTCTACLMLNQGVYMGIDLRKLFPFLEVINDDQILPRVHPNCRCTMLRITDPRDYITLMEPTPTCPEGQHWSDAQGGCVAIPKSIPEVKIQ